MSTLNILHPVLHERTSRHLFCALFVEYYSDQIPEQFYLTNRAALTVLCSVVKHAESGQSMREVQGETRDVVFFSTRRYYLPARFFRNFTFNQRKKAREKSQKMSDIVQFGRQRDSFGSALCSILSQCTLFQPIISKPYYKVQLCILCWPNDPLPRLRSKLYPLRSLLPYISTGLKLSLLKECGVKRPYS